LLTLKKTPSLGSRIDIVLTLVQIGFFFGDHKLVTTHLAKAEVYVSPLSSLSSLPVPRFLLLTLTHRLIEAGGDWDRRNRLKVYRDLHLVAIRQFKRGGELFIDALSTFTTTELISYNNFVALTATGTRSR
jgi:26S proteasome regulatory subunit N7